MRIFDKEMQKVLKVSCKISKKGRVHYSNGFFEATDNAICIRVDHCCSLVAGYYEFKKTILRKVEDNTTFPSTAAVLPYGFNNFFSMRLPLCSYFDAAELFAAVVQQLKTTDSFYNPDLVKPLFSLEYTWEIGVISKLLVLRQKNVTVFLLPRELRHNLLLYGKNKNSKYRYENIDSHVNFWYNEVNLGLRSSLG